MRILVACEFSGLVRDAFIAKGHEALSCDLEDSERPGPHYKGDVLDLLNQHWDMLIAFPPCTYLCSSGMHWTKRGLRDPQLTEDAAAFFLKLWNAPIEKISIENPVGIMSTRLGKPTQKIHPYEFGHDVSKTTCLWLKGLPELHGTKYIIPKLSRGTLRWGNQSPCGGDNTSGHNRAKDRSRTYSGIAQAMAEQWG